MSELYKEQHPLLYDDLSDDDFNTQNYNSPPANTHLRPVVYSGRVKNQMKGAAAILSTWPGHWWSTFKYWWMGLGMIAIIVFIFYNSILALSLLPITYTKAIKPHTSYNNIVSISPEQFSAFNIYMHIFAEKVDQVNLDDFLPYIEIISNKNQQFKFNVIVVLNEKSELTIDMNDETKNYLALNSLWADKSFEKDNSLKHTNIAVNYISLDKYLDDSPLQKFWGNFSQDFVEFLVRCLSIWEKGGIALNPVILTPNSPNPMYMKKIHNLFNSYKKCITVNDAEINENVRHTKQSYISKKKLNNIRDIIEALEMESKSDNNSQYNLTEAENKDYSVTVAHERDFSINENYSNPRNLRQSEILISGNNEDTNPLVTSDCSVKKVHDVRKLVNETKTNINNSVNLALNSNISDKAKPGLLPLFIEYLFPKRSKMISLETNASDDKKQNTELNSPIHFKNNKLHGKGFIDFVTLNDEKYKRDIFSHYETEKGLQECETDTQLTIDLKGYIIASNKGCHAFVGNLLSNAVHYAEVETLTNFIITELTIFCKGVMSSCKGIDVISL